MIAGQHINECDTETMMDGSCAAVKCCKLICITCKSTFTCYAQIWLVENHLKVIFFHSLSLSLPLCLSFCWCVVFILFLCDCNLWFYLLQSLHHFFHSLHIIITIIQTRAMILMCIHEQRWKINLKFSKNIFQWKKKQQ